MQKYFLYTGPQTQKHSIDTLVNGLLPAKPVDSLEEAEAIIAVGGDGTMLHAIREHFGRHKPFIGINSGHLGFLMNPMNKRILQEVSKDKIQRLDIRLLRGNFYNTQGDFLRTTYAFNEIYLRSVRGTAHISVKAGSKWQWSKIPCDGVMVASPAGSTAYNRACGGTILPLGSNLYVVTPIAGLPKKSVTVENHIRVTLKAEDFEHGDRIVYAMADNDEVLGATTVIVETSEIAVVQAFAESVDYRDRIFTVQFS